MCSFDSRNFCIDTVSRCVACVFNRTTVILNLKSSKYIFSFVKVVYFSRSVRLSTDTIFFLLFIVARTILCKFRSEAVEKKKKNLSENSLIVCFSENLCK